MMTRYRVQCARHNLTAPVLGEHMARVFHDECRRAGWYVTVLEQRPRCYCHTLPGSFCDFCTGLRSFEVAADNV